jgi:hypothetical protein
MMRIPLVVKLLPVLALPAFAFGMGAPATYDVVSGAIEFVSHAEGIAELRVTYDLKIRDANCGWIMARFREMPADTGDWSYVIEAGGKTTKSATLGKREGVYEVQHFGAMQRKDSDLPEFKDGETVRLVVSTKVSFKESCSVRLAVPTGWEQDRRGSRAAPPLRSLSAHVASEVEGCSSDLKLKLADVPEGSALEIKASKKGTGAFLTAGNG